MSYLLRWVKKPGDWLCFEKGREQRLALRWRGTTVDWLEETSGPASATLVVHEFPDEKARNTFLTRIATTVLRNRGLRRDEARERRGDVAPPRERSDARHVTRAAPAKKRAAKRKPTRPPARPAMARRYAGDPRRVASSLRALASSLRALGCDVEASFGAPATAAAIAKLEKLLPAGASKTLRALYEVHDGFSVEWSRDDGDDHGIVLTWLSVRRALAAHAEEKRRAKADAALAVRGAVLPLIEQYDGSILGLDLRRGRDGEYPMVFLGRLDDEVRGLDANVGTFLETLQSSAFSHPGVPDVAHRTAERVARALARARGRV